MKTRLTRTGRSPICRTTPSRRTLGKSARKQRSAVLTWIKEPRKDRRRWRKCYRRARCLATSSTLRMTQARARLQKPRTQRGSTVPKRDKDWADCSRTLSALRLAPMIDYLNLSRLLPALTVFLVKCYLPACLFRNWLFFLLLLIHLSFCLGQSQLHFIVPP